MPTEVTQGSSKHVLDVKGVAGFSFWLTIVGIVAYAVGYSGSSWHVENDLHTGVWEQCHCSNVASNTKTQTVQAMTTLGLICIILAFLLGLFYLFIHVGNKTITLVLFMAALLASVLFMVIGIVYFGQDYGSRPGRLGYSFAMACTGLVVVGIAAILSLFQLARSTCKCC